MAINQVYTCDACGLVSAPTPDNKRADGFTDVTIYFQGPPHSGIPPSLNAQLCRNCAPDAHDLIVAALFQRKNGEDLHANDTDAERE